MCVGVMNLVITVTGDPAITDKIVKLSHNVLYAGVSFFTKCFLFSYMYSDFRNML